MTDYVIEVVGCFCAGFGVSVALYYWGKSLRGLQDIASIAAD